MEQTFWAHKSVDIPEGVSIGKNTKIWHNTQVIKGAIIGEDCVIGHNCYISSQAVIGNGVKIGANVGVWDLVTLENYVFVAPSVVFTNDLTPRAKYPKQKFPEYGKWLSTIVKEGASIGANSTILCNTIIGKYAMIGAGTIVTKNMQEDYAIYTGFPGKRIGWACECGQRIIFTKMSRKTERHVERRISCGGEFGIWEEAKCEFCKRRYMRDYFFSEIQNKEISKVVPIYNGDKLYM